MNRLLWIASVAFLLTGTTGCLHHHTRGCNSGTCGTCPSAGCPTCSNGACGTHGGGVLGHMGAQRGCSTCGMHGGRTGCVPGPLGWQQGGLQYSNHLGPHGVGAHVFPGHYASQYLRNQSFNPGPPTGTVAYPYYTHRGPRDFLLDNPPSIGR